LEREYKFLVADHGIIRGHEGTSIVQGYVGTKPDFSLRIRFYPTLDTYQLAIKGPRQGPTRVEVEEEVGREIGELALLACPAVVEKTRYGLLGPDGRGWDVDVFHGLNQGLVLAELEVGSLEEKYVVPSWCGDNVTEDPRFYNDYLASHPYSTWA